MKISIALATYNGEKYLQEQLNSILEQSMLPDEVVVSDDHSKDKTTEILNEFKSNAPFEVIVIKNKESGLSKNFNNALMNTTGDLVFMCDQDDVWFSRKIEKVFHFFKNHPDCQVAIHDVMFCDHNLNELKQTKIQRFKILCKSVDSYDSGMATTVKNTFLKNCLPVPDGMTYDSWIHSCANTLNVKCIINEVYAYYRRHSKSVTRDSLINKPFKPFYFDYVLDRLYENPLENVIAEMTEIEYLIKFLDDHWKKLLQAGTNPVQAKDGLIQKKEVLVNRYKLLNKKQLVRIPLALDFYFKGGYTRFSGWKSMIKDILH